MAAEKITREQILQAEEFTRVYRENADEDVSIREARCLAAQYPRTLLPIRENDLFAGLTKFGIVGFASKNDVGFGYCCHSNDMEAFLKEESAPEEDRKKVSGLLDFWREECCRAKTRAAFDEDMAAALPYDDLEAPGVGFPLYRMAGWVLDYTKLMKLGVPGLKAELKEHMEQAVSHGNTAARKLYEGMLLSLGVLCDCAVYYCNQIDGLLQAEPGEKREKELQVMRSSLCALQNRAPETLHEALQLMWLYSLITVTMDYGRMDDYAGQFYVRDLKEGRLTEEEGLELLKSLWTMIADTAESVHGRVMLGGKNRADEDAADRFALIAMEASRQVVRHVPQLSLRLYEGCNPALFEKALDVLGSGRTFPILYNDDVNIPSVIKAFGVEEKEAADYFPFGCGEYVLGYKSFGSPNGIINILKALELAIFNGKDYLTGRKLGPSTGDSAEFRDFEELYAAFLKQCEYFFYYLAKQQELEYRIAGEEASYLLQSMLYEDCMERGKGVFSGGIRYLGGTVETYGNISAADSLYAIKRIVFDTKQTTMEELGRALQADFEGYEGLWKLLKEIPKFGNDDEGADAMAARMHEDVCGIIAEQGKKTELSTYLAVLINNDHNVKLGGAIGASADGRRKFKPMSNANGPTSGNDTNGITALMNSMTKLRTDIHAGEVQNMKFSKDMFRHNREMVKALLETYFAQGGSQAMITVVDRQELENAMREPENYQDLFVRVGGYSGRFVYLPKEVQLDVLNRTLYE